MIICVDVRCLMHGRRTGVEEYTLSLLLSLFERDKKNEYVLFLNSWRNPRFDFVLFGKYPNVKIKRFKIPNKILNFFFWYLKWPKIDNMVGGADWLFLPNICFFAASNKTKLMLTMHDLSFERYPEHFSLKRRMWHAFINPRKICERAELIMAVSDSTKNDIVSLYGIERNKVRTVYGAINEKLCQVSRNDEKLIEIKNKYELPFKFILFLGTIEPRKNIKAVIRAFDQLQKNAHESSDNELKKYALVIAGSKGWMSEKIFKEIIKSRFMKHIQVCRFIEEVDKKFVYNLASIVLYTSIFEGFGFPPLEAMRCGVPVIASSNSSVPEVIGNGGILIDPEKPAEICHVMREILQSRELRDILAKKGLAKSQEFNWQTNTEKVLGIFTGA